LFGVGLLGRVLGELCAEDLFGKGFKCIFFGLKGDRCVPRVLRRLDLKASRVRVLKNVSTIGGDAGLSAHKVDEAFEQGGEVCARSL
jgi:hypothetical protein